MVVCAIIFCEIVIAFTAVTRSLTKHNQIGYVTRSTDITGTAKSPNPVVFRQPALSDAARILKLVEDSRVLEPNSCYLYLLLCHDFSQTCLVAERDTELVGFVTAYCPPQRPEAVFVWQIGVAASARRQGLGKQLLRQLLASPGCRDVEFLEATVTASNVASRRLFESLAGELNTACTWTDGFSRVHFLDPHHEDEPLIRIGPLERN